MVDRFLLYALLLLILIHIPKTAGTTLSHMLRLHFAVQPANWLHHARTLGYYPLGYARPEHMQARLARIESLSPAQRKQVRFFAAHAGFGLRDRLPEQLQSTAHYLTVLREPVARFISTFHHLKSEGRLERDASLRTYVDKRRHFGLFKFDNCQVRYLAGEKGVAIDVPAGEVTRDMLELAKRRLEHDIRWFGLTERFDEGALMLADMLGMKRPRYVRARVRVPATSNPSASHDDLISQDLHREIADINALDIELHAHATQLFAARIALQTADFPARVVAFSQRNARQSGLRTPIVAALPRLRQGLQRLGLLR